MARLLTSCVSSSLLSLVVVSSLHAQTPSRAPAGNPAISANPTASAQAPDEMTKKISELVHAGKYVEAQKLCDGLLIAYPEDQRLTQAKALIEKLLASSVTPAPVGASTPPAATGPAAAPLTGMDRVDYNALIELARQAQETTDAYEQGRLMGRFMGQSVRFLQKHPEQMLLWRLRAVIAIAANQPMDGYEAGQRLLAAGAADSNDPAVQQLLGQLRNKGWLDEKEAAKQTKYGWILGIWSMHYTGADKRGNPVFLGDVCQEFIMPGSVIEGYGITNCGGARDAQANFRGTILDSGEISWERLWGSVWKPMTFELSNDHRNMKLVFTELYPNIRKEATLTALYTKQ